MRRFNVGVTLSTMVATTVFGVTSAMAATVTVQQGQTMWSIAKQQGLSLSAIESANPSVNPSKLDVGMNLKLPSVSGYRVGIGDTFYTISKKLHVNMSALEQLNPSVNPLNLIVGTLLNVPSSMTPVTSATPATSTAATATGSVAEQNLYWMEHVISAEANAEPLATQIAVGDVIMHRLEAGSYGSTVKDVVFQVINGHYQFTSVENGFIYSTPVATSIQAAKDVLSNHQDVVPGALVFYNPSKTPASSWVRRQPTINQIGALVFAK